MNDFQRAYDIPIPDRKNYKGISIANMGYMPEEAANSIAEGGVDVVAFGTGFLANPVNQKDILTIQR